MLDGINCEAMPLDNRPAEETGLCELLGGCAPACTASRPCPRMACIPQGISTESSQILTMYSAARTADAALVGSGLEVVRVELQASDEVERARIWRLLVALMIWVNKNREALKAKAKRG